MASTYTDFDPSKPAAATQAGNAFGASANANDLALWYSVVQGTAKGFAFTINAGSGNAEQPQYYVWTKGSVTVQATNTWGTTGGGAGQITQQAWDVSTDGATWAHICTQTFTYDSASMALLTTSGGGSMLAPVMYVIGKLKNLYATVAAHLSGTGTGVHGLGTIATQPANSVSLYGGNIDGTAIGNTTPAAVTAQTYKGKCVNLNVIAGAIVIDWTAGDYFYGTFSGAGAAITFTGLPLADRVQGITLEITNAAAASNPWPAIKWPGGAAPSRSSGVDLYEFSCRDGVTVRGAQAQRNSA